MCRAEKVAYGNKLRRANTRVALFGPKDLARLNPAISMYLLCTAPWSAEASIFANTNAYDALNV